MTPHQQPSPTQRRLRVASMLVPRRRRAEWQAEWIAELQYVQRRQPAAVQACARGMVHDAFAVRRESCVAAVRAIDWQRPGACLSTLAFLFATLSASAFTQGPVRHLVFSRWGAGAFGCFAGLAALSIPSTLITSRFTAYDALQGEAATVAQRLLRWRFLTAKLLLVVLSAYLLAVEITQPFQHLLHAEADWLLVLCGLLFNVVAVNWALADQRERCPMCMRLLRNPAKLGPPSWSLLGSCATEERCDRGHGLLHQPEWQTSWFEHARWLHVDRTWQGLSR